MQHETDMLDIDILDIHREREGEEDLAVICGKLRVTEACNISVQILCFALLYFTFLKFCT